MRSGVEFRRVLGAFAGNNVGILIIALTGCSNSVTGPHTDAALSSPHAPSASIHGIPAFGQVNLVSDMVSIAATRVDAKLLNPWGIAIVPNGPIWLSANHSGVSVIYDQNGDSLRSPVSIPTTGKTSGGAPTGVVFNTTRGFMIPGSDKVSRFIFAGEDGVISAWSSGDTAVVVADHSASGAVYKGLALARDRSAHFLYATDFKGAKVDVFDDHFQDVTTRPFTDPGIPAGFAPFNIQNIDGNLYVTYAKQKGPDNMDDEAGPGNGYVDVYRPNGSLIRRFASQGTLNSPWGLAEVPGHGPRHLGDEILVGDFGDGRINLFDEHGRFRGQLSDSTGTPITIPGLWGLAFNTEDADRDDEVRPRGHEHHGKDSPRLFFTAGPGDEADGIFGYLQVARK